MTTISACDFIHQLRSLIVLKKENTFKNQNILNVPYLYLAIVHEKNFD